MAKEDFRARANENFRLARELLSLGKNDYLDYAALRLRMAVECLAYEHLQSFIDDISEGVRETWQPGKLIRELKEIDPDIDKPRSISIGLEEQYGRPSNEMVSLGVDFRLSGGWLNKNWNALGAVLHEPMNVNQRGLKQDPLALRAKLEEICSELEKALTSSIWATRLRAVVRLTCRCGLVLVRSEGALEAGQHTTCSECGSIFGAKIVGGEWKFFPLSQEFNCPKCGHKNIREAKRIVDGTELVCQGCRCHLHVRKDWCIRAEQVT